MRGRFLLSGGALVLSAGLLCYPDAGSVALATAEAPKSVAMDRAERKIDPNLWTLLENAADDEVFSALVFLHSRVDLDAIETDMRNRRATLREQHEVVVTALQDMAQQTQGALKQDLDNRQAAGGVQSYELFWIANGARVNAKKQDLIEIARRFDVSDVYLNYEIELIGPVEEPRLENADLGGATTGGPEIGVIAVRAPEVWAMGIDGTGVLVANIDTGVNGNHTALASRWAGVADSRYAGHPEWAWYDPYAGNNNFPYDNHGHGTHTMGSVCGGAPGEQIGVAPGSNWMAAGPIDRGGGIPRTVADAILSFQWMADPDGNPNTNWDVPAVCSNSWGVTTGHGYPPCDQTFWTFVDGSEAAGTVQLFSAGNEGSGGLRRPADRATTAYNTLAVAAVDANNSNWPIASFSSRGPTNCGPNGESAIKPDIAAPGVNVRSSYGSGYQSLSGTSMASPHVNGVVALMRQANPNLPVDDIKQIIYDTAYDLGQAGEDNSYGWGMIDALEAVQIAISLSTLGIDLPNGLPSTIEPTGGTTFDVDIIEYNSQHQPSSGLLYVDDGGGFVGYPMLETGANSYEAVFPPTTCLNYVNYYITVETTDGETVSSPFGAPASYYTAFSISDTAVPIDDDFNTDMGWTVVNQNLQDGAWERAIPAGGGDRWDPPNDYDGSGFCYVTDNADGNSDVDGGPTRLLSPVLDVSALSDPTVGYARWIASSGTGNTDFLTVEVSDDGGASWTQVESVSDPGADEWVYREFQLTDFVTSNDQFRIRFSVADIGNDSVVEAGIDAFVVKELICSEPADLTGFSVQVGTYQSGVLGDLQASDDSYVTARSGFGSLLTELHKMQISITANTTNANPSGLSIQVESRIDQPNGTVLAYVRNFNTNQLDAVGSFPVGNADAVRSVGGIDATNHVDGSGNIEVVLKYVVHVPQLAFQFDSLLDEVQILVE